MDERFGPAPYVYRPSWEKDVDYNPDHRRSDSDLHIQDRGADVIAVLQVRGLGAIVFRAPAFMRDREQEAGISIFTKGEIGYAPGL